MLPDELAAVAEDREEKDALAGAALAAGAAPAVEATAGEPGQHGKHKKKPKKPCEGGGKGKIAIRLAILQRKAWLVTLAGSSP